MECGITCQHQFLSTTSGVPRGASRPCLPLGRKISFLHSPNCIAMSGKAGCLFARATEMIGDRIAPPRVVGHRTAQFAQMFLQPMHTSTIDVQCSFMYYYYYYYYTAGNAPYVVVKRWIAGADGLPWWSPSQVLANNYGVCGVCTALSGIFYSGPSW